MSSTPPHLYSQYGALGASTRVRMLHWFTRVAPPEEKGYVEFSYLRTADVRPTTLIPRFRQVVVEETRLRKHASGGVSGLAFLSRQASPFSNGSLEKRILSRANWGVYDFDDAIYASQSQSPHKQIWSSKKVWNECVKTADAVIAGNELLAADAASLGAPVSVIPSCIEPGDYEAKRDYGLKRERIILWVGSPSTAHNLKLVIGPLSRLNKSVKTTVLAVGLPPSSARWMGPHMFPVQWFSGIEAVLSELADVAIMPMYDSFYNARKCGYKLLQYAAMGIPSVASPVGASTGIANKIASLTAETQNDWEDILHDVLIGSRRVEREAWGREMRRLVVQHYSYEAWEQDISAVLGINLRAPEPPAH